MHSPVLQTLISQRSSQRFFSKASHIHMRSGGPTRISLLPFEIDNSWPFSLHFLHGKFETNPGVKGVKFSTVSETLQMLYKYLLNESFSTHAPWLIRGAPMESSICMFPPMTVPSSGLLLHNKHTLACIFFILFACTYILILLSQEYLVSQLE